MKLIDLEPQFVRYEQRIEQYDTVNGPITGPRDYQIYVKTLAEAQGITFLCPKCFKVNNNSNQGTHSVEATFANRGVPDNQGTHNKNKLPVRWSVSGSHYHDLTTHPSILLPDGCNWHGFITNGEVSII